MTGRNILTIGVAILISLFLGSCASENDRLKQEIHALRASGETNNISLVTAYSKYLANNPHIDEEHALPILNDMIRMEYYSETRSSISLLIFNGFMSNQISYLKGICYIHEMRYDLALTAFTTALSEYPDPEMVLNKLQQALDHKNVFENISCLDASIQDEPGDIEHYLDRAGLFLDIDKPDEASFDLNRVLELGSFGDRLDFILDLVARYQEEYGIRTSEFEIYERYVSRFKSVLEAEYLISKNPHDPTGYIMQASNLSALKNTFAAQSLLDSALVLIPGHMDLHHAKLSLWLDAKQYDQAIQYFHAISKLGIKANPELRERILSLGSEDNQ